MAAGCPGLSQRGHSWIIRRGAIARNSDLPAALCAARLGRRRV